MILNIIKGPNLQVKISSQSPQFTSSLWLKVRGPNLKVLYDKKSEAPIYKFFMIKSQMPQFTSSLWFKVRDPNLQVMILIQRPQSTSYDFKSEAPIYKLWFQVRDPSKKRSKTFLQMPQL